MFNLFNLRTMAYICADETVSQNEQQNAGNVAYTSKFVTFL